LYSAFTANNVERAQTPSVTLAGYGGMTSVADWGSGMSASALQTSCHHRDFGVLLVTSCRPLSTWTFRLDPWGNENSGNVGRWTRAEEEGSGKGACFFTVVGGPGVLLRENKK